MLFHSIFAAQAVNNNGMQAYSSLIRSLQFSRFGSPIRSVLLQ